MRYLLLFLFQILALTPALSQEVMHSIVVDVLLDPRTFIVSEVRDVSPGDYDEAYIGVPKVYQPGNLRMVVSISGEQTPFEEIALWDPSASTADKQRVCGRIEIKDSTLLAWGMMPHERKTYMVSYTLRNPIHPEGEYDLLIYSFFHLQEPFLAEEAEIHIRLSDRKLTEEDIDLSISKSTGDLRLSDGMIVVTSKVGYHSIPYMPVKIYFRKGLFSHSDSAAYAFSSSELNSPMMSEKKAKTESGGFKLFEICEGIDIIDLIKEYPKLSIFFIGNLLLLLGCFVYRKFKAWRLGRRALLILLGLFSVTSMSAQLYKDDITVVINDQGNARICESHQVSIYQGTEGVIRMYNLQGRDIGELAVSDEQGNEFQCLKSWNIKASLDEKAQKCGIYEADEGKELCWGIGSYGSHTFHVRYTLTRLVKAYEDYDGFIFTFYQAAEPYAQDMHVTIKGLDKYFVRDDTRVWLFGNYGEIYVRDGAVEVQTKQPFRYPTEKMTIMVRFEKGMFHPSTTVKSTFEETVMKKAFKDSEYQDIEKDPKKEGFLNTMGWFLLVIVGFLEVCFVYLTTDDLCNHDKEMFRLFGNVKGKADSLFRGIPCGGDLNKVAGVYFAVRNRRNVKLLRKAHILRMLQDGRLTLVAEDKKKLFKVKKPEQEGSRETQDYTYYLQKLLYAAAGRDHILDPDELKKYVRKDPVKLRDIASKLKSSLEEGTYGFALREKEANEVMGLKQFLEDFARASERSVSEVALWKDYLVYATLFGIDKQVSRDMKTIVPELSHVNGVEQIISTIDIDTSDDSSSLVVASILGVLFAAAVKYVNNYKTPEEIKASGGSFGGSDYGGGRSSGWGGGSSYSGGGGSGGGGGTGYR